MFSPSRLVGILRIQKIDRNLHDTDGVKVITTVFLMVRALVRVVTVALVIVKALVKGLITAVVVMTMVSVI